MTQPNTLHTLPVSTVEPPPRRHFAHSDSILTEELEWTNRLLVSVQEGRDRLLDAIPPCPAHGNRCVPYALEWIEKAKAKMDTEVTRYSHRNGETEPPQNEGWYWFDGRVAGTFESVTTHTGVIRIYIEHGEPTVNITFIKHGYSRHMPAALSNGLWWGPITAPWNDVSP